MNYRSISFSVLLLNSLLFNNVCFSQTSKQEAVTEDYYGSPAIRYEDYIYSPSIKTVLLHDESFEVSQPIINMDSDEKLKFSFDELDADFKNYTYSYIHCNANWEPSSLMSMEYIDGFQENPITNYRYSSNTLQKFVHYYTVFPVSTSRFIKSGNYILKVYENGNPDKIIITKRFMVFQSKVGIDAKITRSSDMQYSNYNQEVDFTVNYGSYKMTNPYSDLKITITKNNNWNDAKSNLKPLFINNDQLIYELSQDNVFPGGSEFRNVNIQSIRFRSDRFYKMTRDSSINHIYLTADEKRSSKRYEFNQDIDGAYLVKNQDGNNSEIDADYCYVHFFLPLSDALTDGNLYLFGGFNGWKCNRENMLHYNEKRFGYEGILYLKQGYYNYEYAFLKDNSTILDETIIEGTHFETENQYTIFIYHKQQGTFYDQLIGVKQIRTGN